VAALKRIAVLGSTGSIGTSTLKVVAAPPGRFEVAALAAGRNVDLLEAQVRAHRPGIVACADAAIGAELAGRLGRSHRTEVVSGEAGLERVARAPDVDVVVSGIVGAVGVRPTLAALDAGTTVALANKESLVVAGAFLTARARETGAAILPVDSEHSALHQCLRGERPEEVRRLWLTASGGPFRAATVDELARVGPREALRHPTWAMGQRITIDSATLMNKGLEVIEARWLFDVGASRIRVVVHPQSVVHSMVEFVDGSFKAQVGATDMRHPIEYALSWPDRRETALSPFDPVSSGPWTFEPPDPERFPCLGLAFRALEHGGVAPAVLNAADEVAVAAFLDGRLSFPGIARLVGRVLDDLGGCASRSIDDVLRADVAARDLASRAIEDGAIP
jgi:1-deoxy-D-xylulose-5-phosphate reductoisomerase